MIVFDKNALISEKRRAMKGKEKPVLQVKTLHKKEFQNGK